MIEIIFGKMNIPEEERFIGFAGDNLHATRTFLLKNVSEENCIYRLYLTFDDGTTNYFLLDSKVENGSTYLTWNILEDHIMKSGLVKAQIKAFCEDERIFHTSYDYFIIAPTAEYDEEISEKENSEFLEYEKRLNEILSYISLYESDFVPNTRTIAGLSLSDDITTELLCNSMKVYPILRLTSAPTNKTAGEIGQLAFEKSSTNGANRVYRLYLCTETYQNGEYNWINITSGNSENPTGISNVSINSNGELEIYFSDGENKNLGKITGSDGKDGEDGTSPIVSVSTFSGGATISIDNGDDSAQVVNIYNGEDGQDGKTPVLGVDYFTESDKEFIVSSVIDYFGGKPLYGFVDENNDIVVSGNLGNGTYTVKYELEDGTTVDIGELTLGAHEPEEINNLFNTETASYNCRLGSDGTVRTGVDGAVVSDFIDIKDISNIRFNGTFMNHATVQYGRMWVYDENGTTPPLTGITFDFNPDGYQWDCDNCKGNYPTAAKIKVCFGISDSSITSDDVTDVVITAVD